MRKLILLTLLAGTMVALTAGVAVAAVTDFRERGTGTAELISEEGCQNGGTCTDRVSGSVAGKPVDNPRMNASGDRFAGIMGTVSSDFSQATSPTPGTYSVPTTGNIRLADRDGGRIFLEIEGTTTGPQSGPNNATFTGTFTVTKGTGQFSNVKGGSGEAEFQLADPGTGEDSRFVASLDGSLRRSGR
jgi:hypothetical protein